MSSDAATTPAQRWTGAKGLEPHLVKIHDLFLDEENARNHPARSLDTLASSLKEFGQLKPIVYNADTKVIITGNGTVMAAETLGWTHIAGVAFAGTLEEALAFSLADNRTAELSQWDEPQLVATLASYAEMAPEYLGVAGFTDRELRDMAKRVEIQSPAMAVEAPGTARTVFSIIFESEADWRIWDEFQRGLLGKYPHVAHASDRLIIFLEETFFRHG